MKCLTTRVAEPDSDVSLECLYCVVMTGLVTVARVQRSEKLAAAWVLQCGSVGSTVEATRDFANLARWKSLAGESNCLRLGPGIFTVNPTKAGRAPNTPSSVRSCNEVDHATRARSVASKRMKAAEIA